MENQCCEENEGKTLFYSSATSDSETDGEELDAEEYDIKKNIRPILNLGQTIPALWSISLIEHAEKVEQDYSSFVDGSQMLSRSSGSGTLDAEPFYQMRHRRAPSLPTQLKLDEIKLKLDEIQLNTNNEYGFNHKRSRPGRQNYGRNTVSLYSSNEKISDIISLSDPDNLSDFFLSANNLLSPKSLARNEKEILLEEEILQLRSQPSKVEFSRKKEAKEHLQRVVSRRGKKKSRRSHSLKRRLSFDSHPRRRAFSDTEDVLKGDDRSSFKLQPDKTSEDAGSHRGKSPKKKLVKTRSHFGSDPEISNNFDEVKVAPPPMIEDNRVLEMLVSNAPESQAKEKRRKSGIPQFLNALKLPNKKAIKKKFMRRKHDRHSPVLAKIPAPFPQESVSLQASSKESAAHSDKENLHQVPSVNTFDRSSTTDGPGEERRFKGRRFFGSASSVKKISCSSCSLQRVDENEESSKFDATLARKSCSTCSIVAAKLFGSAKEEDRPVLERRNSDTALNWKEERARARSPGRRFILRLLSPVVCGLSIDNSNFQSCESYSSLASYGSDLSIEADFLSQKLSDFNPQDVAEELALIDKELLMRITWQELSNCGWMSINKFVTSPNVMNMVEFFNRVAMMVASSILAEETAYIRAKIITKMIKLADKCRSLKNYNSLRAILGGLQCTPIFRLEATWKHVRARRKRLFSELSNLMGETDNFSAYRDDLARSLNSPPCLPFLGDFLTQIAQTQAYLAVQRKRSFTQRMEKASVSRNRISIQSPLTEDKNTTSDNNCSESKTSTSTCNEQQGIAITLESAEIPGKNAEVVTDDCEDNCEKNLGQSFDKTSQEEKNVNNTELQVDETGRRLSNIKNEIEIIRDIDSSEIYYVNNIDENCEDEEGLHGVTVGLPVENSTGLEPSTLCDVRDDEKGQKFITSGDRSESCNVSNKSLDASHCTGVHDNSVFIYDELCKATSTPVETTETEPRGFDFSGQKPSLRIDVCDQNVTRGDNTAEKKQELETNQSDFCEEFKDSGLGSASSCSNSPQRFAYDTSTSRSDNLTVKDESAEQRTHARCDSNDSGVVLQNGRSSRASDELNASRDNLDMIQSNENSVAEDWKLARDFDVIVEDVADSSTFRDSKGGRQNRQPSRKADILNVDDVEETKMLEEMIKKGKPTNQEAKIKKGEEFQIFLPDNNRNDPRVGGRRHLVEDEVSLTRRGAKQQDHAVPEIFLLILVMSSNAKDFEGKKQALLNEIARKLHRSNAVCYGRDLKKTTVTECRVEIYCLYHVPQVASAAYVNGRTLVKLFNSADMRAIIQDYNITKFLPKVEEKELIASYRMTDEVWFPVAAVAASSFVLAFVLVLLVCCCRRCCCQRDDDKVSQLESMKHGAYVHHTIKPIETMSPRMVQPEMKDLYSISGSPRKSGQRWPSEKRSGLLQSRRGSQASLVLDLSPMVREPVVDFSHNSPSEEILSQKTSCLNFEELKSLKDNETYLYKEFWDIPSNTIQRKDKQSMSSASLKNRYPDILPNSKTVVKLKPIDDDPQSTYINANYIRGYNDCKEMYIATEGPLQSTVADFWRMIWECRCPIIIMISKLKEKNEEKCAEYWPCHKSKPQQKFGDITVTFDSEIAKNGCNITKLYINHGKFLEDSRMVTHYWMTSWPDHRVPKTSSEILFLAKEMRSARDIPTSQLSKENGPVVVHCSAGRGRTGCFIAICHAMEQLEKENCLDVLRIVSTMRIDRGGMVQKDEQYTFLHRTLFEYWQELRSQSHAASGGDPFRIEAAEEAKETESPEQGAHFIW
eukprot:gene18180-19994_t